MVIIILYPASPSRIIFLLKFRDQQPFYGVPGVVLSTKASIYASVNSSPKLLLSTMFFSQSCKMFSARFIADAFLKGGAYYCYCAYVLRISRYSDFLSVILTNTGIFLHGLKLSGESSS